MSRRVLVATPSHEGVVTVHYADSLFYTGKLCAQKGIEIIPVYIPGDAMIQRARNELLRMGVESGVDDILFIDADQVWKPENALSLLLHPVDVVGAAVPKKSDIEEYNVKAGPKIVVDQRNRLLVVDAVGTGFLRLSRKAAAALYEMGTEYNSGDDGAVCRMAFDVKVIDGRLHSEDTVACERLRDAGFLIHVDPSFTVDHIGSKRYTGNFAAYLTRLWAANATKQ